jgi:hypothetical protein
MALNKREQGKHRFPCVRIIAAVLPVALCGCGGEKKPSPMPPAVTVEAGETGSGQVDEKTACPSTYEEARSKLQWKSCEGGEKCNYPDGECTCRGPCKGAASFPTAEPEPATWKCAPRPEGCPMEEPKAGSPCPEQVKECTYGHCCHTTYTCEEGIWTMGMPMCPP